MDGRDEAGGRKPMRLQLSAFGIQGQAVADTFFQVEMAKSFRLFRLLDGQAEQAAM